ELIHPIHPGVGPDTPLNQVVAPAASDRLTVPVVSEDNRLLGVIPNVTLLRALGQEDVVMPVDLSANSAASASSAVEVDHDAVELSQESAAGNEADASFDADGTTGEEIK